jgi:cell division protein FtsQ
MSDEKRRRRPGSIVRRARREAVGEKRPRKSTRPSATDKATHRRWIPRPGKRLIGATALVIVAFALAGGVWLWQSPLLRVQKIEVRGTSEIAVEAVLARLDAENESMFTIDLARAERDVASLARVASVHVEQQWPNRLVVTIVEREPWGTWEQAGGEYTVDRDGMVLSRRPAPPGLPVIRSFQAFTLQPGDRVDYQAIEAASEIYALLPEALKTQVSDVAYLAGKGVQVTTTSGQTALLGDSSGIPYKLSVWAAVAQEATVRGLVYSTIDLRYGNRPVLQREEQQ